MTSPNRIPARRSRRRFLQQIGAGAVLSVVARRQAFAESVSTAPRFERAWGTPGKGPGEFSACVGVAVGPEDTIFTAEFRNERVQWFTPEGTFQGTFPVQPHAGGLAVDSDRTVYVAHWNSNKVAAYAADGKLLREWGQKGTGEGEFQLPGSIALGPDQLIYVPDQGNSRIQVFTRDGKFVRAWGSLGSEPGQFGGGQAPGGRFAGPQFVAFDRRGHVYATDAALDRVQKFTPEGMVLSVWGDESAEPGGFGPPPHDANGNAVTGGPISICVDGQDRVWVSATNNRVQQFSNDGQYLCGLGGEGTEPGQFDLPHGLALDSRGSLYVADTMNGRIQKFATT